MDQFHRQAKRDTRTARPCGFCMRLDPDFALRSPLDQLVEGGDQAGAHITEDGHVRHRLLELSSKLPPITRSKHVDPAA